VAQHRPRGSEATPPYAPGSRRFGWEPPSVEDDVDVWRYTILELHARNDDSSDMVDLVGRPISCPQTELPLTSTWPHLRCDVGLEEGEYRYKLSLCYSIVYCYNGVQRYEQFLQVGRLYWALILLVLALCLPSASVSSVFMVLYRY